MKRLKVFLAIFLAIMLALNGEIWAATVTIQQADSIIQTGSATASATNFFNLLAGSLSSNMTATNFGGYYIPNFVSTYTQGQYQALLNSYLSDVTTANYTQAQIDLIKLAAATFKNGNKPLVSTPLGAAINPWTGSGKLFVAGAGMNQLYLQFFVDQFAMLYSKLTTNNNNNNNASSTSTDIVVPVNPGQKNSDPAVAMQLEQANDEGVMDSIATTATQALNTAMLNLEQQMNDLQTKALADPNIKNATTNQSYIAQLQNIVQQAETGNFKALADDYQQQIASAGTTGIKNLEILAAQGGSGANSLLSAYTQNLNLKSTNDQAQVTNALAQDKNTIETLQNSIQIAISDEVPNIIPKPSGGDSLLDKIGDWLLSEGQKAGSEIVAAVVAFYAASLICKYVSVPGLCPPKTDLVDKLGLPDNINDLMTKMGLNSVNDLINKSAAFTNELTSSLDGVLGLEPGTVKNLIGSAIADPGKAIPDFMQKISDIKDQVAAEVTGAAPADIMKAIGQVLEANPGSISDITTLVSQVRATLNGTTPSTGTGSETDDIPGATAFDNLQYDITQTTLQQTLFNNIQAQGLDLAKFQAQMADLQNKLATDETLTEAEKAALTEQIEAGQNIVEQAENAPNDPAENPFVDA